jgi:outer membrane protein assembly factor BamD
MFKKYQPLFAGFLIVLLLAVGSCKSKYEKLKASNDNAKKYQEGLKYYNKKEYSKALGLFEGLITIYRGHDGAEDLFYYYAYTNYKLRDYTAAAYSFKQFADTYPSNPKAEECRFLTAYCYYLDSPNYSLDQENTSKAIEKLQLFINLYPKSDRVAEASKLINTLHDRLEQKSFEIAKLYLTLSDYQSAVIAMNNALRDYPDTKYGEELQFLIAKSQFEYAFHSREEKQEERYTLAMTYIDQFIDKYPTSKYLAEATTYKKDSQNGIHNAKAYLAEALTNERLARKIAKRDTQANKVKVPASSERGDDNRKIPN